MLSKKFDPLKGKTLQVLDQDGEVVAPDIVPDIDDEKLLKAYRTMVLARVADEKAVTLQRQGRLGAYPPNRGQEAASLGPALAMSDDDWLVWAFRELAGLLWKGVPLMKYYLLWMGNEEGSRYDEDIHVAPSSVPVASQLPYAAGIAYASKYRGEDAVTFAFCGDGGTSEGDFHEALNAAGVYKLPMVFIVQNNQWAISVPRSQQTASRTIAQKAVAYGLPGIKVDGNDLLAMYMATREAAERARKGEGATLIEAYTYRLGDHTTSDDARRYRLKKELEEWEPRDPLIRLKAYLTDRKLLDKKTDERIWDDARDTVEKAVQEAEEFPSPTLEDVFQFTYEEMPPELEDELESLRRDLERGDQG